MTLVRGSVGIGADQLEAARVVVRELLAINEEETARLERVLVGLEGGTALEERRASPSAQAHGHALQEIPKSQLRKQFLAEIARDPGITITQAAVRLGTTGASLHPIAKAILAEKLATERAGSYSLVKSRHRGRMPAKASPPFPPPASSSVLLGAEETP